MLTRGLMLSEAEKTLSAAGVTLRAASAAVNSSPQGISPEVAISFAVAATQLGIAWIKLADMQ